MTQKERIEALERKLAEAEARIVALEARPVYVPFQIYPNPNTFQIYPNPNTYSPTYPYTPYWSNGDWNSNTGGI